MKYLVLETNIKYAIVLDEEGRFLKVVNSAYTVGEKVDRVTLYHEFSSRERSRKVWFQRLSIAAACLIIAFFSYFQIFERPIAAMRLSVNPDFRIEWNRRQKVTGVEAENTGALIILENYSWDRKDPPTVVRELIRLCNMRGYFKGDNNTVTITMEEGDKKATQKVWDELENNLPMQLSYIDDLTIKMKRDGDSESSSPTAPPPSSQSDETSASSGDQTSPTMRPSPNVTDPSGRPTVDDSDYDDDSRYTRSSSSHDDDSDYTSTSTNSSGGQDDDDSDYTGTGSSSGSQDDDDSDYTGTGSGGGSQDDDDSDYSDNGSDDDDDSDYSDNGNDDDDSDYSDSGGDDDDSDYDDSD